MMGWSHIADVYHYLTGFYVVGVVDDDRFRGDELVYL